MLSDARFVFFVGGIGSGKTAVGAARSIQKISQGKSGIIVSPDYPHFVRSTWPEFTKWCPWSWVTYHNKTEKRLEFDTGAVVIYGGIDDPDSFRGPNSNWFWGDELARKRDRKAFDILMGRIRVGDDPQGWVTTTPAGRRHWLYDIAVKQEFDADLVGDVKLVELIHASTMENAPNLDPLYVASLKAAYTGKFFAQELEGQFVDIGEGVVYENFSRSNISTDADYDAERGPVELAVDDGYASSPRVILFIQVDDDGVINVFEEIYHVKHLADTCIGEAKDRLASYDEDAYFEIAAVDPSAAQLIGSLRQADIPARGVKVNVIEGIKHLMRFVRDGDGVVRLRIHPRCKNLISEMSEGYRYPEGSDGRGDVKPVKADDHGPDALRYYTHLRMRRR